MHSQTVIAGSISFSASGLTWITDDRASCNHKLGQYNIRERRLLKYYWYDFGDSIQLQWVLVIFVTKEYECDQNISRHDEFN